MKISNCRICKSKSFKSLFSLGKLSFTGKFAKSIKQKIPKDELTLVICNKCKLVQLNKNFDPKYLYSSDYGYRTGINKTMTNHMKDIVIDATKIVKIKKNDYILDIASNDATLLNFYPKNVYKVGIDPLVNKYKKYYSKIDKKISDFFSYKIIKKNNIHRKFKIISALSMFYDLREPDLFVKDIKKILHEDGIFILEHADLLSIVKNCLFDTICHEHLEYYSSKIIINLMKNNGLRVFNIKNNDINGGSMCYFICHNDAKFKTNLNRVNNVLKEEKKLKLEELSTFKKFFNVINKNKNNLKKLLNKISKQKEIIHGYGASTKGNVLLQYFNITNKDIKFISDRNPLKSNMFTPGSKIRIISEENSRKMLPKYYLVLPWHFKNEILIREKKIRSKGTKFIFPLPKIRIY